MPKSVFDSSQWESQFFTTKDILAPRLPVSYLVDPIFPIPSLSVVYGSSGTHKTNLIIDMAVCIAIGKQWLVGEDFPGFTVCRGGVLWVDVDSGLDVLKERFDAMLHSHANAAQRAIAPIYGISFPNPAFTAVNDAALAAVIQYAKTFSAKLIVFDNLGTVSGGQDENTHQMIQVMSGLRFIAQRAEAAVIAIHHDPKNENGGRKTPRGHSSIEAAVDLALLVTREDDAIVATPTKTRRAPFQPFGGLWEYSHKPRTKELQEAKFVGTGYVIDPTSQKMRKAIFDYFKTHKEGNQSQLVEACKTTKLGRNRILSEIHHLAIENTLTLKPHQEKNKSIYTLAKEGSYLVPHTI